jgi:hypothetical protein
MSIPPFYFLKSALIAITHVMVMDRRLAQSSSEFFGKDWAAPDLSFRKN